MSSICELLKGDGTKSVWLEGGLRAVLPKETGDEETEKARRILSTLDRAWMAKALNQRQLVGVDVKGFFIRYVIYDARDPERSVVVIGSSPVNLTFLGNCGYAMGKHRMMRAPAYK